MSLECRKCHSKVSGLSAGLCSECFPNASFMEVWKLNNKEEATRLYVLQQLNHQIMDINKGKGIPAGQGIYETLPTEIETQMKNEGVWQQIVNDIN